MIEKVTLKLEDTLKQGLCLLEIKESIKKRKKFVANKETKVEQLCYVYRSIWQWMLPNFHRGNLRQQICGYKNGWE